MSGVVRPATVRTFDPASRSGTLLGDDGGPLTFPGEAVAAVVRLLRPGQRVQVRIDDGHVVALTLSGLPLH